MLIIIFSYKETVHILLTDVWNSSPCPPMPGPRGQSCHRKVAAMWQEVSSSSGCLPLCTLVSSIGGRGHAPWAVKHTLPKYAGRLTGQAFTSLRHQGKTGSFYSHSNVKFEYWKNKKGLFQNLIFQCSAYFSYIWIIVTATETVCSKFCRWPSQNSRWVHI